MNASHATILDLPGTTCIAETLDAFTALGYAPSVETEPSRMEREALLVIPGGFSFDDAGRPGVEAANRLRPVLDLHFGPKIGICNGFQILVEAGWLGGRLLENESGHFESRFVEVTCHARGFRVPIAHRYGRYEGREEAILRYKDGTTAGVINRARRAAGVMPHPERAIDERFGSKDGLELLALILSEVGA